MTKIGTVIDGKYEVLREIGRGGMSVVYLAMDTHLNKQWAVKEIRKKGNGKNDEIVVNSLLAEADLMKRLDHPALPRIVDIIDNGVTIYVVMDYIEGESLDKYLKIEGPQPEELVVNWAKQLCDALGYLHAQKPPIIYRDMKPANVMLKPEGNIKIIDFGIAREYKEQNLADTTVLGTKGYAPPEQYSGQTDQRSDIFALGMTMHHLLTGMDPRKGEPYRSVRQYNPTLSEGIEIIIDKCVEPAAEYRYQSCADLLYDLEHPELITKGFKRRQKRRLRLFLAAAGFGVMMLLIGMVTGTVSEGMNSSTYDRLISDAKNLESAEEKIEKYTDAIHIYPERTDAYEELINTYIGGVDGLTDAESTAFGAIYAEGKELLDQRGDPERVMELNLNIGKDYLVYYTGNEGFAGKVQRAYPYFESAYRKDIDEQNATKQIVACYYEICNFYRTYVLASSGRQSPEVDNYTDILQKLSDSIGNGAVDGQGADAKIAFYQTILATLYDQRMPMASLNVPADQLQRLLSTMGSKIRSVPAQSEEERADKERLEEMFQSSLEQIRQAYVNEERSWPEEAID